MGWLGLVFVDLFVFIYYMIVGFEFWVGLCLWYVLVGLGVGVLLFVCVLVVLFGLGFGLGFGLLCWVGLGVVLGCFGVFVLVWLVVILVGSCDFGG